jgi:hypothetical protein
MLEGRRCDANILSNALELFQGEGVNVGQTLGIFKIVKGSGLTVAYDGKDKKAYDSMNDFSQIDRHNILKTVIEKGQTLGSDVLHKYTSSLFHTRVSERNMSRFIGKWMVTLTDQNNHIGSDDYNTILLKGLVKPVYNDGSYRNGYFVAFDTQEEAEHFTHYMMTDFVRAYIKTYRVGKKVYHADKYIPWPDAGFSQDWDDDRIAQKIELTDPERAELASILPDCYNIRKPAVSHDTAG